MATRRGRTSEQPERPKRPIFEKPLVDDITMEALVEVLSDNDFGCIHAKDELSGFFNSFNTYHKGSGEGSKIIARRIRRP
ncbi:MAG: DUF3987 domain-containing protein [Planctomycetaceae bacterium]|nr:DUF3987 domain-containing protein [Planctomycetaceae bacterium]